MDDIDEFTESESVDENFIEEEPHLRSEKYFISNPDEFPTAMFYVNIPIYELDTIVCRYDTLCIKCMFRCFCYTDRPKQSEYYICKKNGGNITNRDLINCLIENGYEPECDHDFLEEFVRMTEGQVYPFFTI